MKSSVAFRSDHNGPTADSVNKRSLSLTDCGLSLYLSLSLGTIKRAKSFSVNLLDESLSL